MDTSFLARLAVSGLAVFVAACGGGGGSSGLGLEDLNGDGQVSVLCFGDSITRGVGDGAAADDTPPPPAGYPLRLQRLLAPDSRLPLDVIDDGKPSEQTSDGVVRLRRDLEIFTPDYAILLEGTNDVEELKQDVTTNIQTMIDSVIAAGAIPILGTITPSCCDHQNQLPQHRIRFYNDQLRAMAKDNSIPLIDFFAAFSGGPEAQYEASLGLIHDPEGLHPTPAGYDLMALTAQQIF